MYSVGRDAPPLEIKDLVSGVGELSAADLVYGYALSDPAPSMEVRYNLACFLTTIAGCSSDEQREKLLNAAIDHLEHVQDQQVVEWARVDPSLELLRVERSERFDAYQHAVN
jgi:hypothetical protein